MLAPTAGTLKQSRGAKKEETRYCVFQLRCLQVLRVSGSFLHFLFTLSVHGRQPASNKEKLLALFYFRI